MNNRQKEYKLEVKIQIQEYDVSYVDFQGAPVDIDDVLIDEDSHTLYAYGKTPDNRDTRYPVTRHEQWNNGGRLSVEEIRNLGAMGFMRLMGVLGEMHKAIDKVQ